MLAADQIENLPPIDLSNVIMLEGRMLFLIVIINDVIAKIFELTLDLTGNLTKL